MNAPSIYSAAQLADYVQQIGFLPLLDGGIDGFSAEEIVDSDCRYNPLPDGGWEWPLWKWKGSIITEGGCVYGKFFAGKTGFVSRQWWPHLCNYRRSCHAEPAEGSIEEAIVLTLQEQGSLITRELRAACGFGPKTRSKFDSYITRLQMGCRIITEDFIYPRDRHNHEYGWGWALLTTPEQLYGHQACLCENTPKESYSLMLNHLQQLLPQATAQQIARLLG
ncbi:MAG: hypothetical protein IKI28_10065 [Bacteroidales bacterium]|nr:hypothetical protein [Bacteroidales bacterium]